MDEGRKHSLVCNVVLDPVCRGWVHFIFLHFSVVKLLYYLIFPLNSTIWSMKSFHYYAWPWDWEYENMRISRRLSVRRAETDGREQLITDSVCIHPVLLCSGATLKQNYWSVFCVLVNRVGVNVFKIQQKKTFIEPSVTSQYYSNYSTHFSPMKSGHLSMSGGLPIKHEGNRFPPNLVWTTIRRQGRQCIWVYPVWCWLPAH